MPEYIELKEAIDLFYSIDPESDGSDGGTVALTSDDYTSEEIEEMLSLLPAADVAPVVHGKNLTEGNSVDEFKCSHCGAIFRDVALCQIDEDSGDESYYEFEFRFCPRCGMIVDLEEKI